MRVKKQKTPDAMRAKKAQSAIPKVQPAIDPPTYPNQEAVRSLEKSAI